MRFEKISSGGAALPPLVFPKPVDVSQPMLADTIGVRACRDCKFFSGNYHYGGARCNNPNYKTWDMVHGWQEEQARSIRADEAKCGKAGAGWRGYTIQQGPGRLAIAAIPIGLLVIAAVLFVWGMR